MRSVLGDIVTAVRLLTVLPVPGPDGVRPARYFGYVGWIFAAVGVGIAYAVSALGAGTLLPLLVAALIVTAWALLTGVMHWDGLADCADGLGVRGDAERKRAVMRESGIGAFGVMAIVLTALVQVAALAVLIEGRVWWPIAAAPVLGRLSAAAALVRYRPARPDGLGARYAGSEPFIGHVLLTVALVPLVVWPPIPAHAVALAAGFGIALSAPAPFARAFGGITGDVAGASVILTETVVLVGAALAGGWL